MGDDDGGGAEVAQKRRGFPADGVAQALVEVGEGLVHQEQRRLRGKGAGKGYALLLAARQHVRVTILEMADAEPRERVVRPLHGGPSRHAPQAEEDILAGRQVREQGVVLEHEPDVAILRLDEGPRRGDHPSVDRHRAGIRVLHAGDDPEERRLPGAGLPHQARDVSPRDLQRNLVKRLHRSEAPRRAPDRDRQRGRVVVISIPPPPDRRRGIL